MDHTRQAWSSRKKVLVISTAVLFVTVLAVGGIGQWILYRAAIVEVRSRLTDTVRIQARLIEAMHEHERTNPQYGNRSPEAVAREVLEQFNDAHANFRSQTETGELVLAQREGDHVAFLAYYQSDTVATNKELLRLSFGASWGEPMQRALSGESGTIVALDYRGETVLAAFEPVAGLNWGVVAKVNLAEVRAPFNRAAALAGGAGLVTVAIGVLILLSTSGNTIRRLEDNEERTRTIVESTKDVLITTDRFGVIQSVNPAAEKVFGYTEESLLTGTFDQLLSDKSRTTYIGWLKGFNDQKLSTFVGQTTEQEGLREDGQAFPLELTINAMVLSGERMFLHIVRDIRFKVQEQLERAAMEYQLNQAQKMEALGQMAGGMAHEFNNLLVPMIGLTEITLEDLPERDPARENLRIVLAAGERARSLIKKILAFSRVEQGHNQVVAVNAVVRDALVLLRAGLPTTIELKTNIPEDDLFVSCDSSGLHQIIMNLGGNARDAIGDRKGGKIRVDLEEKEFTDCPRVVGAELMPGRYARLAVADNGDGIREAELERIFDPFFTTKEVGRGTGMGLSTILGIVAEFGGGIGVKSTFGEGATFEVLLPLLEAALTDGTRPGKNDGH